MPLGGVGPRGAQTVFYLIDRLHDRGIRTAVVTGYTDVPSEQGKVAVALQETRGSGCAAPELTPARAGQGAQKAL